MNREALLEGSRSIQPILPHLHRKVKKGPEGNIFISPHRSFFTDHRKWRKHTIRLTSWTRCSFFFSFFERKEWSILFCWFYCVKCSFIFPYLKEMPLISQDLMSYLHYSLVKSWDQKYPFVCAHINTYTQFKSLVKSQLKICLFYYTMSHT